MRLMKLASLSSTFLLTIIPSVFGIPQITQLTANSSILPSSSSSSTSNDTVNARKDPLPVDTCFDELDHDYGYPINYSDCLDAIGEFKERWRPDEQGYIVVLDPQGFPLPHLPFAPFYIEARSCVLSVRTNNMIDRPFLGYTNFVDRAYEVARGCTERERSGGGGSGGDGISAYRTGGEFVVIPNIAGRRRPSMKVWVSIMTPWTWKMLEKKFKEVQESEGRIVDGGVKDLMDEAGGLGKTGGNASTIT